MFRDVNIILLSESGSCFNCFGMFLGVSGVTSVEDAFCYCQAVRQQCQQFRRFCAKYITTTTTVEQLGLDQLCQGRGLCLCSCPPVSCGFIVVAAKLDAALLRTVKLHQRLDISFITLLRASHKHRRHVLFLSLRHLHVFTGK